jgi:hypothetical protein
MRDESDGFVDTSHSFIRVFTPTNFHTSQESRRVVAQVGSKEENAYDEIVRSKDVDSLVKAAPIQTEFK